MGLLDYQDGRDIVQSLACFLSKRRMGRRLHRSFMIAFDAWKNNGGTFSLETMLNELNDTDQGEINQLNQLLIQLGCSTIGSSFNGGSLYVNSDTGSDETGDGTQDNPFATLAFLNGPFFPQYIDWQQRIIIEGNVSADEIVLSQTIGPSGSLSIVGGNDPTTVTTSQGSGPFSVTSITQYGTPVACNNIGVAETFGVNELYGNWILFLTGACAGEAVQIHDNTASNLFTRGGLSAVPAITDTFIIVIPTDAVSCPKWDIQLKGGTFGDTEAKSRFNIYNLGIAIASATYKEENFRIRNTVDSQISFVTFYSADDQFRHLRIESNLNRAGAYDVGAALLATTDVDNLNKPTTSENAGLLVKRGGFPPGTFGFDDVIVGNNARVHSVDTAGRMTVEENIEQLNTCAIGVLRWQNGASGGFYICYISGDSAGPAVDVDFGGSIQSEVNYLKAGLDAFQIVQGMLTVNGNTHGTFTGYGFRFDQGIGYVSTKQDPSSWSGTTGDIWFAGGVGATAFPVATDARVTDAIANFFARIETA